MLMQYLITTKLKSFEQGCTSFDNPLSAASYHGTVYSQWYSKFTLCKALELSTRIELYDTRLPTSLLAPMYRM